MSAADEYRQWLTERPAKVRAAAERLFPPEGIDTGRSPCVRQLSTPAGHYGIVSYHQVLHEDGTVVEGAEILVKIEHLADSFLPGVQVFDVLASDLVPCGCGVAGVADDDDVAVSEYLLDEKLMKAQAEAARQGLDWETLTPEQRRSVLFRPQA